MSHEMTEEMNKKFLYEYSIISQFKDIYRINTILEKSKSIYFIGISGIGMSALAQLFKGLGKKVGGSSDKTNEITDFLVKKNIRFSIGHSVEAISEFKKKYGIDCVIYTEAISKDNPEYVFALQQKIPVFSYAEGLAYFFNTKQSIAVCGTHGKSSTTAMVTEIFQALGKDPAFVCGAILKRFDTNGKSGSDIFIGEACEYRESFLHYFPESIICPSIELDHVDYFKDEYHYLESYKQFFLHLGAGYCIVRNETKLEQEIYRFVQKLPFRDRFIFYSNKCNISTIDKNPTANGINGKNGSTSGSSVSAYQRADIVKNDFTYTYDENTNEIDVYYRDKKEISFVNPVPALAYASNCTAIYIYLKTVGLWNRQSLEALQNYKGIQRRFDILGNDKNSNIIITDYAHHPSELQVILSIVKAKYRDKKRYIIFQPHQYSRTKNLFNDFVHVFKTDGIPVFLPIYAQRDTREDIASIKNTDLFDEVKKSNPNTFYMASKDELFQFLSKLHDNVLLFCGAGSIYEFCIEYYEKHKI